MFLLKKGAIFFTSVMLLLSLLVVILKRALPDAEFVSVYAIYVGVCMLIALFLGLCISLWREDPSAKNSSYNIALGIVAVIAIALPVVAKYHNGSTPATEDAASHNRDLLAFGGSKENKKQQLIAYDCLVKYYGNERAIQLDGGGEHTDSAANATTYFRFTYFVGKSKELYAAKIKVVDTTASFIYVHSKAKSNSEVIKAAKDRDEAAGKVLRQLDTLNQHINIDSVLESKRHN